MLATVVLAGSVVAAAGGVTCCAGGVVVGVAVAVTVGCVVAGAVACSVALEVARLRLREPPALVCVAIMDIAAIRISLRMITPDIRSIRLT